MSTVLVADDDPQMVEFLEMVLEEAGYTVLVAVGVEVVHVARSLHLDLILLEVTMAGMDGVKVSQRLRRDPLTADIPIIAMSARHRLRTTAALMPVNDRLTKPFQVAELLAKVDYWANATPQRATGAPGTGDLIGPRGTGELNGTGPYEALQVHAGSTNGASAGDRAMHGGPTKAKPARATVNTLARLQRMRPDLYARVLSGELSPYGAAITAGFRKRSVRVIVEPAAFARAIRKHCDAGQIEEIVALLQMPRSGELGGLPARADGEAS